MKVLSTSFILAIIFLSSCTDDDSSFSERSDIHNLKGKVSYYLNDQPIEGLSISISDRKGDFLGLYNSCDNLDYEIYTDSKGQFDFSFESHCDANVRFYVTDSLKAIYDRCYSFDIEDSNDNKFSSVDNWLQTERGRDYFFEVKLRPTLKIYFRYNEIPDLELDSIEIEKFNLFPGYTPGLFDYKLDDYNLQDDFQLKLFYADGTTKMMDYSYDYFDECDITIEIDR